MAFPSQMSYICMNDIMFIHQIYHTHELVMFININEGWKLCSWVKLTIHVIGHLLKWGWSVDEDGFLKFLCSHHVLNDVPQVSNEFLMMFLKFPMSFSWCSSSSQWVPHDVPQVSNEFLMMFLKFPMCSLKNVPNHTSIYLSHILCPKFSPSHISHT